MGLSVLMRLVVWGFSGPFRWSHRQAHGDVGGIYQGQLYGSDHSGDACVRWQQAKRGEHDQAGPRVRALQA